MADVDHPCWYVQALSDAMYTPSLSTILTSIGEPVYESNNGSAIRLSQCKRPLSIKPSTAILVVIELNFNQRDCCLHIHQKLLNKNCLYIENLYGQWKSHSTRPGANMVNAILTSLAISCIQLASHGLPFRSIAPRHRSST
eukprot:TRINITY_DN10201_c0_g1_i1.p3 TRINITY_DN10201_c0_g1~~TRINITY_DN10201_c0_g1_i1.p3  ORF type:complete len:141 (-),score=13.90 TRINITY_DN10201_c0_g1_i1:1360-1782(-)